MSDRSRDALRTAFSVIILVSTGLPGFIGIFFPFLSDGLISGVRDDGSLVFCRDHHGSENDAVVAVLFLAIFILPASLRWWWRHGHIRLVELGLAPVVLVLVLGMQAAGGCGGDLHMDRHYVLPWFHIIYACLIAYPVSVFLMMFVRWPKLILP